MTGHQDMETEIDAPRGRPLNRHEIRSNTSTKRLLDTAAELIAEHGYGAMTVAAVGERAGYSRGLVSAKFGSKDALLEALLTRITRHWSDRTVVPRSEGRTGLQSVIILLDAIKGQIAQQHPQVRALYRLMFEASSNNTLLRDRFIAVNRDEVRDFETLIRRGQRDGSVVATLRADDEAAVVVAALRGIAYQWMLDPDGFDPVVAHTTLAAMVEQRLAPTPAGC